MRRNIVLFSLIILFSALFYSCKKKDSWDPYFWDKPPVNFKLMVAHMAQSTGGVDFLVNEKKINTAPLAFGANTGYLDFNEGRFQLRVVPGGGNDNLITGDPRFFEQGKNYSLYAYGTATAPSKLIEGSIVEDDLSNTGADTAKVRFFHLVKGAPKVNIYAFKSTDVVPIDGALPGFVEDTLFVGARPDTVLVNKNILFGDREYGDIETKRGDVQKFSKVKSQDYKLVVTVKGLRSNTQSRDSIILTIPSLTLSPQKIYSVIAKFDAAAANTYKIAAAVITNK